MSKTVSGGWLTVRQVIDLFVAMGCEPQEFPGEDVTPLIDWTVYYLYSPINECFVSLVGFDPDDMIAPSTIEAWERALGVPIPRPHQIN